VSGYAMVFAGLSGDILKTSLRDLSKENPFLNNNVAIQNTVEKMNINAGVKGNVGAEFGYKIMAYYKELDNLQMFVNNPTLVNRFDVIYDNGSSEILGLDGQLHIKASDVLSIGGRVHIFNYELATENEAWFKPSLRMVSNARLNLSKNLYLDGELLLQSETYAKTFDPVTMLEDKVKMKAFMDLSAGVGYQINNQIGVFFRANNLTATPYQKYLYYSRLGMNIFGGLNYSF
jgi:outer membrane cobalamin receptor